MTTVTDEYPFGAHRALPLGPALPPVLALVWLFAIPAVSAETLREVIVDHGLQPSDLPAPHSPDRTITSYATLDQEGLFAIAYYDDDSSGILEPPLRILRYDERASRWQGTEITENDVSPDKRQCFGSVVAAGSVIAAGSVVAAGSTSPALYFTTHVTPSASCTFVLAPELILQPVLYGWMLGSFADGALVYHESQVHFAPTHAARLSLYTPATGESRTIYPMRPYQTIREAHMARVRTVYDDPEWCRQNNHHCDPERFDNSIPGPVAIDDASDAIAFVALFSDPIPVAPGATPEPPLEVLYVYRQVHDPAAIEYRELLLDDFRRRFGDLPVASALSPEILDRIFAD